MPRQCRVHVAGGVYHAVLRGNHRQDIFGDRDDYLNFERILDAALERYGATLFAYCWMTNHVHLAVRVADVPLGEVMRIVASRYARWRQRQVPTTGHLFERRYCARLVDADRYLLALVRYIYLNPVRAGIVMDPRHYPWSSHRAYLGEARLGWLCVEPVLEMLGGPGNTARAAYQRVMGEEIAEDERDALSLTRQPDRPRRTASQPSAPAAPGGGPDTRRRRSLDAITAEVAIERGICLGDLMSRQRRPDLVRARVDIARRALREGAATLSQVARHVGRAPSTLSDLLRGTRSGTLP